jgi:hypothetical protein
LAIFDEAAHDPAASVAGATHDEDHRNRLSGTPIIDPAGFRIIPSATKVK